MNITIVTLPHKAQRYDTGGDWQFDEKGNLLISVSELGNWKREFLVAMHELIEAALCKDVGITTEEVDDFDMAWEEHDGIEEPGDDPAAPYYHLHQIALAFEHHLAVALGINFRQHDRGIIEGGEPK